MLPMLAVRALPQSHDCMGDSEGHSNPTTSMTVIPPCFPLVVTPVLVQPTPMRVRSADGQEQGKEEGS